MKAAPKKRKQAAIPADEPPAQAVQPALQPNDPHLQEQIRNALARLSLQSRVGAKWALRPVDPAGADKWPALIDLLLALHDVLSLDDDHTVFKLGLSTGMLAQTALIELQRDKSAGWHASFSQIVDMLVGAAPEAEGKAPSQLMQVFSKALLARKGHEMTLIPVLNPYQIFANPAETIYIFAGMAKKRGATLDLVHDYVDRAAQAIEPFQAGTRTLLRAAFAHLAATGGLLDRFGITNEGDRRDVKVKALALAIPLDDDDQAWRELCSTVDVRCTATGSDLTPAGPDFGTMAVSSTRSANPVSDRRISNESGAALSRRWRRPCATRRMRNWARRPCTNAFSPARPINT